MAEKEFRVLLAGGGTGGHLFPALAIADEIKRRRRDARILFVGARDRIESRVVPEHGYELRTIWISGFSRRLSFRTLLFPLRLLVSIIQSIQIMNQFRPRIVVGTGGYVSGPVVATASLMGVPSLIHEQNNVPGITTRMLGRLADEVCVSFESTLRHFRTRERAARVSGNPTRASIGRPKRERAARFFGLRPRKRTVLVFGGSAGAVRLNDAMVPLVDELASAGVQLIWQTGSKDYPRIRALIAPSRSVAVVPFIDRMEYAYAACDVAICRAGATTIAELTRAGVPAILVPYPYATAEHQRRNAEALVDAGAAVMLPEEELPRELRGVLLELIRDRPRRLEMRKRGFRLAHPDAARELAKVALGLAGVDRTRRRKRRR